MPLQKHHILIHMHKLPINSSPVLTICVCHNVTVTTMCRQYLLLDRSIETPGLCHCKLIPRSVSGILKICCERVIRFFVLLGIERHNEAWFYSDVRMLAKMRLYIMSSLGITSLKFLIVKELIPTKVFI